MMLISSLILNCLQTHSPKQALVKSLMSCNYPQPLYLLLYKKCKHLGNCQFTHLLNQEAQTQIIPYVHIYKILHSYLLFYCIKFCSFTCCSPVLRRIVIHSWHTSSQCQNTQKSWKSEIWKKLSESEKPPVFGKDTHNTKDSSRVESCRIPHFTTHTG